MKVVVIGAGGHVGKHIVATLHASSDTSIAQVRHAHQADEYRQQGIETRLIDLEAPLEEITAAMQGADAVIFSAGSGGSTGEDKTLLVDLDGAVKSIQAAQQTGISRFVMVSALGADKRERWNDALKPYYVAKHYADEWLKQSGLDYTILRPGRLSDEAPTHRIAVGYPDSREGSQIPRQDVAAAAVAALHIDQSIGKEIDFVGGEQDMVEALTSL
ncbi:SDR family oxidoreductase [Carnimonas nigrificans]|uniref:SDR family oxidoreductase n=1 Tax=Carnimonas nigrificans TaxID=64323 RepID=UPI0004723DE9|nr:SDR family oxidoreductase [Carnimonas nigrificans]